MSDILEDIQKRNDEYHESLESLRRQLAMDFNVLGNAAMEEALAQDVLCDLTTDFHIMLTSCGGVEVEDGIPKEVRGSIKLYDRWDKSSLCMASAKDLVAILAMGLIRMPADGFYLCTPGALNPDDKELYARELDVIYSEDELPLLGFGTLGKCPVVEVPDWARYALAQNSFNIIATEIVREQRIFCFPSRYSYILPDELPKASKAIVSGLVDGIDVDESLFSPPPSLGSVERWRMDALEPTRFVLSGPYDADMERISSAYEVWKRMCKEQSVASVISADKLEDEQHVRENLRKLGECICIRPAIDAHLSGVPIDDIFA